MTERKWERVPGFDFKDILYEKRTGAIAGIKACFNAATTCMRGIETVSAQYLWKYYASEEAEHWKNAFWQKQKPDWQRFRRKEIFPEVYEGEEKGES